MRLWSWLAACLALATAGCDCRGKISAVEDAGHPYDRVLPSSGLAAGATLSRSDHFLLVGELNAPAGSVSRSEHFILNIGTVEATP